MHIIVLIKKITNRTNDLEVRTRESMTYNTTLDLSHR